jgi:tetratricopeptide (TPR) repeat protein
MTVVAEERVTAEPAAEPARQPSAIVPLLPGFAVAAIWLVWAARDGGYFPTAWYPGALVATALLLTLALARPRGAFARSPATVPLALFAAWTAWNAISLLWSDAPGTGRESTNELLTVVVMGAVMAATAWRTKSVLALFGLWAAGIAAIAAVDLVSFAAAARPETWLLESRYLGPTSYANGTAALGAMAFWPLLALAARPATPVAVRIAALPVAAVVMAWALLPQSRGTMIAAAAVLPLFLALSPNRVRTATRLVVVGGALLLCVPALFDVYTASREARPLAGVVDTAVARVAIAAALALAASIALVALERRVIPGPRAVSVGRGLAIAAAGLALLGGGAVAVASHDRIRDSVTERWDKFSSDATVENTETGARLGQVTADKRYDYWRVGYRAFRDRPITGLGAGGFEPEYTAEKRYAKHARYAHNLWVRALSETGVIGLALLVGALAAGLVALVRRRLRGPAEVHAAIAAAAALSTAFFLQCSLDWLEEVPALLAPAVGLPLAALRASASRAGAPSWRRTTPAVALAVVALVAMAPAYLAVRQLERGDDLRASDPAAAAAAYDRAAGADPLSLTPHLRKGFLGLRLRDDALARSSFREALDVQENWVARFELGLLDAQAGRFRAARLQLRRAAELNANDPLVTDALAAVEERKRLDPLTVNAQVLDEPVLAGPR